MAKGVGKLILFGEYSVLWNFPGLGISLDLETRIVKGTKLPLSQDFLRFLAGLFYQGLTRLEEISIASSVPIANGLGSSAALCVALARHLLQKTSVWEMAHRLEQFFHHRCSGIDTGLAEEQPGTICQFIFDGGLLPKKTRLGLDRGVLVFASIHRPISTFHRVSSLMKRIADPVSSRAIRQLGEIAQWVIGHLGDWQAVAEAADAAQQQFSLLHISDTLLEDALRIGKQAGAWGGKMSGSGGSFCLFCKDLAIAEKVQHQLAEKIHTSLAPQIIDLSSNTA